MDFLNDKIQTLYFKYLSAAFGSAMITSIYSIVDMAMVGKYQGPEGTAALAIIAPVWNIIFSLGLLMGIGGSVLFSILKGIDDHHKQNENEFFTASLIGSLLLSGLIWFVIIFFDKELLIFFGAQDHLLSLAQAYLIPIKFVVPSFLFVQMLSAFLRNDKNPTLATIAVFSGGIFNIIGDYVFVFGFDMGIFGAGLATAMGSVISLMIILTHFISKHNTLKIVKPHRLCYQLKKICITGFSTFLIDVAMGILTILFNRQIMKHLGTNELSVYGIIVNISTFVQCCAYSVGQASQPIISVNFGGKQGCRIKETLKYAIYTIVFFSLFWTSLSIWVPQIFVNIFMTPTKEILKIAPGIIGCYGLSFLLLPINVYSTYYFQALSKPTTAFIISLTRGLIISGFFILTLPLISAQSLWLAMPLTEMIVAVYAIYQIMINTKNLPDKKKLL